VLRLPRTRFALLAITGLGLTLGPDAGAQPRKTGPVTRAELERLDKKLDEQQRRLDKLIKLQQQYLQALGALTDGTAPPAAPDAPPPAPVAVEPKAAPPPPPSAPEPKPVARKPKAEAFGNVVGKVTGVANAVVYVEDIVVATRGTAAMKQENKQFVPAVLIVQKGTTVQFPNMDAIFHNVFSVTPDNSFDLGNYRQGESKGVTMTKPGVVSVYCNMHPQMVGHILVVPNGNYVRAGKDGFFRLSNVPAGKHRVVAWAPDAKPVASEVEVSEGEPVTVEIELKQRRGGPHVKKDGLPYGSYEH